MSDVERFKIESPTFEYGYKMVVLAAEHERFVMGLKAQHDATVATLEAQLKREREKVAALEKAAERAKAKSLGVVRVVK